MLDWCTNKNVLCSYDACIEKLIILLILLLDAQHLSISTERQSNAKYVSRCVLSIEMITEWMGNFTVGCVS